MRAARNYAGAPATMRAKCGRPALLDQRQLRLSRSTSGHLYWLTSL
jgi:hypothetical protein